MRLENERFCVEIEETGSRADPDLRQKDGNRHSLGRRSGILEATFTSTFSKCRKNIQEYSAY